MDTMYGRQLNEENFFTQGSSSTNNVVIETKRTLNNMPINLSLIHI